MSGWGRLADRSDDALALLVIAAPAEHDAGDRLEVHLRRHERLRRGAHERNSAAEVVRRVGHVLPHEAQDLAGPVRRGHEHSAVDQRPHLVQAEYERGDDAEVATAAAQTPVQVAVLRGCI